LRQDNAKGGRETSWSLFELVAGKAWGIDFTVVRTTFLIASDAGIYRAGGQYGFKSRR
jgi:hypothetical protein